MFSSSLRSLKVAVVAAALSFGATAASAVTVSINSFDNGWYKSSGAHYTSNSNIIAGPAYNNWFAFDLSSIVGNVTSATLTMFGKNGKYLNNADTALYQVFDVNSNLGSLIGGNGGASAYKDLETGTLYGETKVSTPGTTKKNLPQVSVVLKNALADINASTGGNFAIGGSTDATGYLWGYSGAKTAAKLTLTTSPVVVPLPATLSLMGLAVSRTWRGGTSSPRLKR